MADLFSAGVYSDARKAPDQHLVDDAVVLRLPLEEVRAASATIEVIHPTLGRVVGPSAVTVPTTLATLTGPTLDLSKLLPASGVDTADLEVGRRYLLDGPGARPVIVAVEDVNAGVGVAVDRQLSGVYPTGSTLRDTILTHDVGTLERARGYRARWVITPSSSAPTARAITLTRSFDVVWQVFELALEEVDVVGVYSEAAGLLGDGWRDQIRGAVRAVLGAIDARGLQPDRIRDTRPFTLPAACHVACALVLGRRVNGEVDLKLASTFDTRFRREMDAAFNSMRQWYDAADENEKTDGGAGRPLHFYSGGAAARRAIEAAIRADVGGE